MPQRRFLLQRHRGRLAARALAPLPDLAPSRRSARRGPSYAPSSPPGRRRLRPGLAGSPSYAIRSPFRHHGISLPPPPAKAGSEPSPRPGYHMSTHHNLGSHTLWP